MRLILDPYAYQHLDINDITILNTVAHIIIEDHEEIDEEHLIKVLIDNYKKGMKARALQIHANRVLNLTD